MLNLTQREYQEERNIVVKVVSIIAILLFTGCSNKDINLDPISTLGNQLIKVIKGSKKWLLKSDLIFILMER